MKDIVSYFAFFIFKTYNLLGDKLNYKINGYYLDNEQMKIVLDNSKYLLVVAGAGSGKTLTILGKIGYLIKKQGIPKEDILCISFTREASSSLKKKIKDEFNIDMDVFTFHKLALEILKNKNIKYEITSNDTLDNIIHDFLNTKVLGSPKQMNYILKYFREKYKSKDKYLEYLDKNKKNIEMLEKLLLTFIHLFKCNGYNLESFTNFLKLIRRNIFTYKHNKLFLIIVLNIYLEYEEYLKDNEEIDFDDMIIKATNEVKTTGINKKYKYIIIDEYQDSSYIRFNLIKEIINDTGASLMVVGDDFQSIYRFSGCDLNLFLNFDKYFSSAKVMKIQNTYRNSQELIKIAGNFVMKNKKQIKKKLKSSKHINKPIKVVYYKNIKKQFLKLVLQIYKETLSPILVLGRNNKDVYMILDDKEFKLENDKIIYLKNKDIKIRYLTAHKSKGLEEENVIVINLENKLLGFPNKIKDEKILNLVSSKEKYLYAEERRLFYVALTRTKNYVYLLVPKTNESVFIKELNVN